jgi:hypothetical protein
MTAVDSISRSSNQVVTVLSALLSGALLSACAAETPCETLCKELVYNCDYAAYPSAESCLQGCEFDESKGADIDGELECIEAATCDPIETVSCARQFNPEGGAR